MVRSLICILGELGVGGDPPPPPTHQRLIPRCDGFPRPLPRALMKVVNQAIVL